MPSTRVTSISFDPEVDEWLEKRPGKRSAILNAIIRDVMRWEKHTDPDAIWVRIQEIKKEHEDLDRESEMLYGLYEKIMKEREQESRCALEAVEREKVASLADREAGDRKYMAALINVYEGKPAMVELLGTIKGDVDEYAGNSSLMRSWVGKLKSEGILKAERATLVDYLRMKFKKEAENATN